MEWMLLMRIDRRLPAWTKAIIRNAESLKVEERSYIFYPYIRTSM